jgi:hypothetical protein
MNNTKHKPLHHSTYPNERDKQTFLAIWISASNVSPLHPSSQAQEAVIYKEALHWIESLGSRLYLKIPAVIVWESRVFNHFPSYKTRTFSPRISTSK